jgi:hypothetical protein
MIAIRTRGSNPARPLIRDAVLTVNRNGPQGGICTSYQT